MAAAAASSSGTPGPPAQRFRAVLLAVCFTACVVTGAIYGAGIKVRSEQKTVSTEACLLHARR